MFPLRTNHQKNLFSLLRASLDQCQTSTLRIEQNVGFSHCQTCGVIKPSTISTAKLKTLLSLHMPPINLVVFQGSYLLTEWVT